MKLFIIYCLNNKTNTKQRVVRRDQDTFTAPERDLIVRQLIKMGHGAEVRPA